MQTVSIIGLGFVGLSTAVVFASRSIRVIGVEKDDEKLNKLQQGKPTFHEPKLEKMLKNVLKKGLLRVSKDISDAVRTSKFTFITVGTPALSNGAVDLSYIREAAIGIGKSLSDIDRYHVVVVKSTVPPGTTDNVVINHIIEYSKKTLNNDFGVVSNPEFLKAGSAIDDSLRPHILVIGSRGLRTKRKIISL